MMRSNTCCLPVLIALCLIVLTSLAVRADDTAAHQDAPLTVGEFTVQAQPEGVVVAVSAPLGGGSGAGYAYRIYRDTQPLVATAQPIATATSLPYTDTSAQPGALYFYKVVGVDSGGATAAAAPAGLGGAPEVAGLAAAVQVPSEMLNVVFLGDSITQGAGLPDAAHQSPPPHCAEMLRSPTGKLRFVFFSNQGHSGHTTTDFLPGGGDFEGARAAAAELVAAHPNGRLIFHMMLGTNDSATTGTHLPARTPEQITENTETILGALLTQFPNALAIVAHAPLYSPNTRNGSDYQSDGLARLVSYFPALDQAVEHLARRFKGRAYVGDTTAPGFFAAAYRGELIPENGRVGTFYLHPNPRGAADLGRLWAQGIEKALETADQQHRR